MRTLTTLSLLLLFSAPVLANDGPTGRWKTIDDKSGKPRSIVEIQLDASGALQGTIVHIFPIEGQPDDPVCEKCPGSSRTGP
ncbi:MAG: DUF2147 domain-containing protein, partial [Deltaproteobacteria bacterium]|nr:DUF2147 domain-containing protein [Deltaproteobacteria bacterium]